MAENTETPVTAAPEVAAPAKKARKVTIDNKEYEIDSLNEAARNQLGNLQVANQRIAQLQQELALVQTARSAYAKVLSDNLPKEEE